MKMKGHLNSITSKPFHDTGLWFPIWKPRISLHRRIAQWPACTSTQENIPWLVGNHLYPSFVWHWTCYFGTNRYQVVDKARREVHPAVLPHVLFCKYGTLLPSLKLELGPQPVLPLHFRLAWSEPGAGELQLLVLSLTLISNSNAIIHRNFCNNMKEGPLHWPKESDLHDRV